MSMIIRVGAGVIFSGLFFYVVSLALPVRGGIIQRLLSGVDLSNFRLYWVYQSFEFRLSRRSSTFIDDFSISQYCDQQTRYGL